MERGVYFDAWFPLQHNYHPGFPPRRLRMIDHLEDYRATMLVWAALGGGNLALPYLEEEAFGPVPARYRVYGFVNDAKRLVQPVRDEGDADAARAEAIDQREDRLGVVQVEQRRRLVEHDEARAREQRSRDLDELPFGEAKVADWRVARALVPNTT